MLRFKNYLSEEVLPTAGVKNGAIDIENTAVRGQINATLANVTAQPAVTPYIVLHRISKALSYFHIIMPKRAYLEGDKGVEVVEVKQFGHRMGMTNDGQFIHDVPSKYYLFISYRLASSMGVDYSFVGNAASSVGGMFKVTAKLVDEAELQSLLSMAEVSLAEDCDAEKQQLKAKAMAPKEGMHTALGDCDCSQGDSPSTKSAVDTSMRRKDKKLSAAELDEEQIDELSRRTLGSYIKKAHVSGLESASKGEIAYARKDRAGLRAANKTGEKREQGINRAADKLSRVHEETLDELKKTTLASYIKKAAKNQSDHSFDHGEDEHRQYGDRGEDPDRDREVDNRERKISNREKGINRAADKLAKEEYEQIYELYGKGSLGKIKGHHEKEAKRAYKKDEKTYRVGADPVWRRGSESVNKSNALEKKSAYHYAQSERASGLMSRLKPETGDDPLSWRSKSKGLVTRGPRKGKPYAGDEEQKKIQIRHALGKHKKANLPEETLDEAGMPSSVAHHKEKLRNMTPEQLRNKFAGKSEEQLKSMARRHGYGKDSDVYSKHIKEDNLDELWEPITGSRRLAGSNRRKRKAVQMALGRKHKGEEGWNDKTNLQHSALKMGRKLQKQGVVKEDNLDETHADNIRRKYREKEDSNDHTGNVHLLTRVFGKKKEREASKQMLRKRDKQGYVSGSDSKKGYEMTKKYASRLDKLKEETLDEKLTKAMSAGDIISDFVHSKDPKFKGKSKKMRQKMALGAYYGMHPEKSKLEEMASRLKKTTAHRKMAKGVNTQTRHALGAKQDETKTMLVTKKGDPRAAAGGGVRRIPKDKFDPSIYNRASE